jgi:probable F420-dependent oxidoreductase
VKFFVALKLVGIVEGTLMKLAVFGINFGPCADPDVAARIARHAEAGGLESVWTGEHVVLPEPQVPPSPVPASTPFLDPAVALTLVAAETTRIRLGTGIIILPQRNPAILAKEMASVDIVSKGRLIFGVGAGYLEPEFRALGVSFDDKGERTREFLEAMVALWTQAEPEYHGRFVDFAGVNAFPRPAQKPHPPIVMGGQSAPAYKRAVTHAHGWYGFGLNDDATKACLAGIRRAAERYERPSHLGQLEISVTPFVHLDRDAVKRFEDLGVHRIIAYNLAQSEEQMRQLVDQVAGLG